MTSLKTRTSSSLAGWTESFVCGIHMSRSKSTLLRVTEYMCTMLLILIHVGLVLLEDPGDAVKNEKELSFLLEIIHRKCESKKIVIIYKH